MVRIRKIFVPCWLALAPAPGAVLAQELPSAAERKVDYRSEVRPLFEKHCYGCHGPARQINGLRLDRKADALRGGDSGPAIVPGESARSRLIRLVAGYRVKVVMPPEGERLSPEQIGLLRAWIDQGAEWPDDTDADAAH